MLSWIKTILLLLPGFISRARREDSVTLITLQQSFPCSRRWHHPRMRSVARISKLLPLICRNGQHGTYPVFSKVAFRVYKITCDMIRKREKLCESKKNIPRTRLDYSRILMKFVMVNGVQCSNAHETCARKLTVWGKVYRIRWPSETVWCRTLAHNLMRTDPAASK
jgi:hypothetical protein